MLSHQIWLPIKFDSWIKKRKIILSHTPESLIHREGHFSRDLDDALAGLSSRSGNSRRHFSFRVYFEATQTCRKNERKHAKKKLKVMFPSLIASLLFDHHKKKKKTQNEKWYHMKSLRFNKEFNAKDCAKRIVISILMAPTIYFVSHISLHHFPASEYLFRCTSNAYNKQIGIINI